MHGWTHLGEPVELGHHECIIKRHFSRVVPACKASILYTCMYVRIHSSKSTHEFSIYIYVCKFKPSAKSKHAYMHTYIYTYIHTCIINAEVRDSFPAAAQRNVSRHSDQESRAYVIVCMGYIYIYIYVHVHYIYIYAIIYIYMPTYKHTTHI
jgi:hypothetical protein